MNFPSRLLTARKVAALLALFCVAGIAFALFMQYVVGVVPCLLCVTQRFELIAVGVAAAIGLVLSHYLWGVRLGLTLSAVFSLLGIVTAGWQIHIQINRPESVQCGPGVDYIFSTYSLTEIFPMLFEADGDCAIPGYIIDGWLTIPQASLAAFIFAFVFALYGLARSGRDYRRDLFR